MRRINVVALILILVASSAAVEDGQVMYMGGTAAGMKAGAIGRLETTDPAVLVFTDGQGQFSIPYAGIDRFEYSRKLAHELGVLPTIAVGVVKQFKHRHFFRIQYHDANGTAQVAVFEVSKEMPQTLLAILQARAPRGDARCARPWLCPASGAVPQRGQP